MKKAILFLSIISVIISSGAAYAAKVSSKSTKPTTSSAVLNSVAVVSKQGVSITAEIPENVGVINIVLHYRAIGSSVYHSGTMHANRNGEYRFVVSQADVGSAKFEYYIEATKLAGQTLTHGHANLPIVASFAGGKGGRNIKVASGKGLNQSGDANDPLWKNKWLWIGVGVLAAAAISNNNEDDSASKPGYSITIEGPQPEPTPPQ